MQEPNSAPTHGEIAGPAAVKVNADQLQATVVTPHLECEITPGKNALYCATFQIAWNEFRNSPGGSMQFSGVSEMVKILDKKTVTRQDLDETSYVAMAGRATSDSSDIRAKIARELNRKFAGAASPGLLSKLNSVSDGAWVAYAYLFKQLPFEWAFDRLERSLSFGGHEVENFGIRQFLREQVNEVRAASQVLVYDNRAPDDFIVELKTRSKSDRLILAKVHPGRTLGETIVAVQNRMKQHKPGSMEPLSDLLIPVIDFDVLRQYGELLGQGSPLVVAEQQIRFKLNEQGAILKSEAVMARALSNKNLVFDKPFLVMIQRTDAKQPYFALWVDNAELLVPFGPRY